jgi:hypothetical protein
MEHAKKYVLVDPVMYSRTQAAIPRVPAAAQVASQISSLDSKVREILEGNEPDDVKAKHYAMALKKFRVREPVKYADDAVDETEILESVPTNTRHKAKRLLRIIKDNPHLAWNERGELIHNQTTLRGSSIVELFNDILKQRKVDDERPIGWRELSEGLGESNEISKDLVPNYGSWKVISLNKRPVSSLVQPPAIVTVERRRRSRAPERTPARTRRLSWDEY